ncbi:glycoside hydrolase family 3 N-terminal domain-containing protein, partial [Streptococcus suis]
ISGKMASSLVAKALENGVYTFTKHFALNDQEDNRDGVATWSNEQAIREIYLKAFEIPVKEGGATAIMSSFNRIGTLWAGGNSDLLNTVLRDEWGFKGMVITDFAGKD